MWTQKTKRNQHCYNYGIIRQYSISTLSNKQTLTIQREREKHFKDLLLTVSNHLKQEKKIVLTITQKRGLISRVNWTIDGTVWCYWEGRNNKPNQITNKQTNKLLSTSTSAKLICFQSLYKPWNLSVCRWLDFFFWSDNVCVILYYIAIYMCCLVLYDLIWCAHIQKHTEITQWSPLYYYINNEPIFCLFLVVLTIKVIDNNWAHQFEVQGLWIVFYLFVCL